MISIGQMDVQMIKHRTDGCWSRWLAMMDDDI